MIYPDYTVIRDTREKLGHGWNFEISRPNKNPPKCAGQIIDTLTTGDYSVVGYDDMLIVERKNDFSELWGNFLERKRFEREMDRLRAYRYRLVIVESVMTPEVLSLSPASMKRNVPGKALTSWLMSLVAEYQVPIMFGGACGQKLCQQFFEAVIRLESRPDVDAEDETA